MTRQRALDLLSDSKHELQARFGVSRQVLFGSTVHDMARSDSDVDVLVAIDGPATSVRCCGVRPCLEDLLVCPFVLATKCGTAPSSIDGICPAATENFSETLKGG